jgi:hypothetical protein
MDFQGGKNANALFARVNGLTELKTQNSPKRLKTAPKKKCRGGGGGGVWDGPWGCNARMLGQTWENNGRMNRFEGD